MNSKAPHVTAPKSTLSIPLNGFMEVEARARERAALELSIPLNGFLYHVLIDVRATQTRLSIPLNGFRKMLEGYQQDLP